MEARRPRVWSRALVNSRSSVWPLINNAIFTLGRMKAVSAADPLRKLLADENMSVQTNVAIALYRITGEKVAHLKRSTQLRTGTLALGR